MATYGVVLTSKFCKNRSAGLKETEIINEHVHTPRGFRLPGIPISVDMTP